MDNLVENNFDALQIKKQADNVICDVCSGCVSQIHLRRHKKGKKCLKIAIDKIETSKINYCSNNA